MDFALRSHGKGTLRQFSLIGCRLVVEIRCTSITGDSEAGLNSSCSVHYRKSFNSNDKLLQFADGQYLNKLLILYKILLLAFRLRTDIFSNFFTNIVLFYKQERKITQSLCLYFEL